MKKTQKQLIAAMRQLHQHRFSLDQDGARTPDRSRTYDFSSHPAFEEIRLLQAASSTLRVPSPFFRRASAIDGARICFDGQWYDNYCSYNYIGLNQDPRIAQAVTHATQVWGVSATASRMVGGERDYHHDLEGAIADFLGTQAALTFVSGHATNAAILRTLIDRSDVVFVDSLAHNSIFEGIVASGASHITFPHNDMNGLRALLGNSRSKFRHSIIATEGLFSMDGDLARLPDLIELKDQHDSWLMVDEAHSLGVVGKTGRGIAEEYGIPIDRIEIVMGTLSKSLCASGGYVAGSDGLIELLKCKAPGFVYSVGLSAPVAAAAKATIDILNVEPERVTMLRDRSRYALSQLTAAGFQCAPSEGFAVVPVILGDSVLASRMSHDLLQTGICVAPIIAPAVPNKSACLRFFITIDHTEAQLDHMVTSLIKLRDS